MVKNFAILLGHVLRFSDNIEGYWSIHEVLEYTWQVLQGKGKCDRPKRTWKKQMMDMRQERWVWK